MSTPSALHSKKTPKWGTPQHIIECARELLDGQIMLDPASSPEFNQLVRAWMIYTEQDNGLVQPWSGHVMCNPPGGKVRKFWERLLYHINTGDVSKAVWIGFSVEQLCQLTRSELHPLDFSTCILRSRLPFNTEALIPGESPSHGNYVTALGCDRRVFDRLFSHQGKIIHGILS